jgi:hypothetical protein
MSFLVAVDGVAMAAASAISSSRTQCLCVAIWTGPARKARISEESSLWICLGSGVSSVKTEEQSQAESCS